MDLAMPYGIVEQAGKHALRAESQGQTKFGFEFCPGRLNSRV